jgi:hypothetical protein
MLHVFYINRVKLVARKPKTSFFLRRSSSSQGSHNAWECVPWHHYRPFPKTTAAWMSLAVKPPLTAEKASRSTCTGRGGSHASAVQRQEPSSPDSEHRPHARTKTGRSGAETTMEECPSSDAGLRSTEHRS